MTPNLDKVTETISNELLNVLASVDVLTSNPGVFCTASTENTNSLSLLMKSLFKVSADSTKKTFGPFQELLVEGFDSETIWEELQTRNRPLTRFVKKKIGNISDALRKEKKERQKTSKAMKKNASAIIVEDKKNDEGDVDMDEDDNEDADDYSESEAVIDTGDSEEGSIDEQFNDDQADDDDDEDNGDIDLVIDNDDDDGFEEYEGGGDAEYDGIDDMQAWLDQQEDFEEKHQKKLERLQKLAAQKGAVEEGPDSDDEEDDMLFVERQMYDDLESDDGTDGDDEDSSSKKKGSNMKGSEIKYEDFFRGGVSTSNKKGSVDAATSSGGKKRSKVMKTRGEDSDDDSEDGSDGDEGIVDDDDDSEGDFDETGGDDYDFGDDETGEGEQSSGATAAVRQRALTTHEKRNLKMASQIAEIENQLIAEKPWDMRGEVKSLERPENSLLEITAQVERASKSAPMATEEFSSSLEEMIIKRIRDEQFDDVVLKEVDEDVIGTEEREDLSQEKSRIGLGEVYAEDFLATATSGKSGAKEAKDNAVRDELKELYHKVCRQLDGLSHFHFTPKPVVLESRVYGSGPETALPSLSLEDIIPSTESSSALFAPEEIKDKKRGRAAALVADEELSRDDKRRLRRASKTTNKKQKKSKDAADAADDSHAGAKARRKQEDQRTDEVLRSDHRVVEGTEEGDSGSYAKSAVFFSKLQRTAQEAIGGAIGQGKGKGKGGKKGYDPDSKDPSGVKQKASGFKL